MDAELLSAAAVVDIDPSQAETWFELVNDAYLASNDDWDTFSGQLKASAGGAFDTPAEVFLQHVADRGKIELISRLVADLRELPSAYASSKANAAHPAAPGDGGGVSWDSVVQQFGAGWANWDGSEAGWAQFRDWTYTGANEQSPEMYALVYEKLNPLEQQPPAERAAKLTELGFTIKVAQADPAQPGGSPWDAVVQQFGAGWANWDGSDAGWAQFRDWTYTSANTQSPELYAAAYEKLNPLNNLAPAARIAQLAELGLDVHVPAPTAGSPAASAAEPVSPEELDKTIEAAVAEALKEVPGAESLTPEEVAEIHDEIRAEIEREGTV